MSLKGFHILFILLAFLCSAGFWGWTVFEGDRAVELGAVTLGNLSGSLALALFFYGLWFVLVKSKRTRV